MAIAGDKQRRIVTEPRTSPEAVISASLEHGEVFTRPWVVRLILDLAGYTADKDLARMSAVEPACGSGAFLGPIVERLLESCAIHGRSPQDATTALNAFDLLPDHVEASRRVVEKTLLEGGWTNEEATLAAMMWVNQGDYLLRAREPDSADFVLGNPPYIRLEDVPDARQQQYREACSTMTGRSDIYVGFFEVGLDSLRDGGVLGFICADRWMRNQYGRHLRELVSAQFNVSVTISMHDVDAFEEQVSAYPAISIIRRAKQAQAVVADTTRLFSEKDAQAIVDWTRKPSPRPIANKRFQIARLPHWFEGGDSWPMGSPRRLALIEELNDRLPPLEDAATGTRVGIGVATGADGVFVTRATGEVEQDRLLPLSMVRDTIGGTFEWSGHYLVNPWNEEGRAVALDEFPRLQAYFESKAPALRKRNIAGRYPSAWYRTIDKVDHALTERPKLLFPDMKMTIHPVLEEGGFYPHHNLYYIVSAGWDLRVLGGLLLSRVAQAFIEAYAVKMRGGTLRFQAQYLRRIRVPDLASIGDADREQLVDAFLRRDVQVATQVAMRLYGIDDEAGIG